MRSVAAGHWKFQSTSKSQTCTKEKVMVTVWWFVILWSVTAFWILAKQLHLRSMLRNSMRCSENCNACSQHWSTERAQFSKTKPESILYNQCFKSWTNWATKFCFIRHVHLTSHQPTTTSATTFCKENASTTSRKQKMLSKSPSNPKAWIFYAAGINFLLIGKSVLIVVVPVLINKDALEPRYNDLKFMVQTYNNVCTNLIFIWWLQVLVAACELSWGMWGPDPRPRIEPCPLHWERRHWDSKGTPSFSYSCSSFSETKSAELTHFIGSSQAVSLERQHYPL